MIGIAHEVVELVGVAGAADDAAQWVRPFVEHELGHAISRVPDPGVGEDLPDLAGREEGGPGVFVRDAGIAELLEQVSAEVVPQVVHERGVRHEARFVLVDVAQLSAFAELADDGAGEVVHAERMLETRMHGRGVHRVRLGELPDAPQALEGSRVDEPTGRLVERDRPVQRIADDVVSDQAGPAASAAFAIGLSPNFLKFSRNILASLVAWAS